MKKLIQTLLNKIEMLINLLQKKDAEFMDINDASKFLKLKKTTIYQLVFKRGIPFYKCTKKLLFKKSELIDWVEKDKVCTISELESKMYLNAEGEV